MDFKKSKGGGRRDDKGGSSNFGPGDDTIDASPAAPPSSMRAGSGGSAGHPRNIQDTKAYKETSAGAKRAWGNYRSMLIDQFRRMPRAEQESLVTRLCQIVTIGSSMLVISIFYPFLPLFLRVFALPLAFIAAYWAGTRIVSPIIIVRYEQYLNREY